MSSGKFESIFEDFYIPDYILVPGTEVRNDYETSACPVIVFINGKSGGQLGSELLVTYRSILNKNQVTKFGFRPALN
jgi:diacylglycerol kinase (ATP)